MKTVSTLIMVVAVAAMLAGCAPAPANEGAPASCTGKCDDLGGSEAELLYGERRPVGPVGDFGITAEWTDSAEFTVAAGARARLVLEPQGHGQEQEQEQEQGSMPELTVYRDWGTSVEWVAQSEAGATVLELENAGQKARYLVEIYGPPDAAGGAILELQCAAGDCGLEVD